MGKMPWLKLYTEIRTDPKMQALSDAEFRVWINLLCLAAESKVRGVICIDQGIPYPDEALARAMYTDPDTLKGALAKFIKLRMVEIDDDGIIYLINFDARQYDKPSDRPEAVAERVRRHRAKAKAEAERRAVQEVFEHYCRVIKPVKLTEKRKAKIKARLADFTVDELKRAIDNLARDPWIMGDNERGKFYATIEYVFRSTEKTEEWINKFDGRKGVKQNGQDRQPPRASPSADAGAGVDLNKFLWKGT